jgi:diacylglycerol kinase (ATP)
MSRVVLVSNPASGGADDDEAHKAARALGALGDVRVLRPRRELFDREVRAAASEADVVVTAGGDGSLNYTLNALDDVLGKVVLGLVPMGTGNDLARTLRIPEDPEEAAAGLARGSIRRLDVGRASGPGVRRLFINACMGGFPVRANEAIDDRTKKRLGPIAFWVGGAKALTDYSSSRVVMNGIEAPDCIAAGVGNGRTCGGGMEVWPRAQPDDGVLDGCMLTASNLPAAVKLAAKVKAGAHERLDGVFIRRDETITIEADPAIEFNVDGELIDLRSPAIFELAGHVDFLVPV